MPLIYTRLCHAGEFAFSAILSNWHHNTFAHVNSSVAVINARYHDDCRHWLSRRHTPPDADYASLLMLLPYAMLLPLRYFATLPLMITPCRVAIDAAIYASLLPMREEKVNNSVTVYSCRAQRAALRLWLRYVYICRGH